ncbi:LuxR C-terminal-related transcriptional regulator [Alloalcanivorax mobilis]|uniref:LuxR C-terminal-related transcriptional regulator n=1 Tax=Alloalcanivorax mobilis TaxID=2019569 RepID=UPI000B5B11F6|nr:LuxR C-terminal-related transcriptional regulator [Alloalcanivorax mobilis]ASK35462.1 LuxR family transcriptional regulator [Alcanivorax sp. N3-2A]|tara:strand:- start:13851 stop:14414 length:564 start_codon:yes stop_codon:yes gene_type:complete
MDDPATPEDMERLAFRVSPAPQVITRDRVMMDFNEAFNALFGYRRDDLLGQSILRLYPSMADFEAIGNRCLGWLQRYRSYSDERFMQYRDGEVFWARANGYTLTPEAPFGLMVWHFERIDNPIQATVRLTPRERQISAYIVNGLTCKEIGRKLGISHRTVEVHRARLMKKLEAKNTAELVSKIIVLR